MALKVEGVIEEHIKRNRRVIEHIESLTNLQLQDVAVLRVTHGVWRYIRLRYLVPGFYLFMIALAFSLLLGRIAFVGN